MPVRIWTFLTGVLIGAGVSLLLEVLGKVSFKAKNYGYTLLFWIFAVLFMGYYVEGILPSYKIWSYMFFAIGAIMLLKALKYPSWYNKKENTNDPVHQGGHESPR